jgi:hypothetical protein
MQWGVWQRAAVAYAFLDTLSTPAVMAAQSKNSARKL